jgi:hypothetical protein
MIIKEVKKMNKESIIRQIKSRQTILGAVALSIIMAVASISFATFISDTAKADEPQYDPQIEGILVNWTSLLHPWSSTPTVFYNHSIYIFGGYNGTAAAASLDILRYFPDAYDGHSAGDTIYTGETLINYTNAGPAWVYDNSGTHIAEDCVWFLGGADTGDDISVYTFHNNTCWLTGHTLVRGTRMVSRTVMDDNGIIYVFGGRTSGPTYLDNIQAYNYANGTSWDYDTLDIGNWADYGGAYSETDGEYYMVGGRYAAGGGGETNDIVVYNFTNHTAWKAGSISSVTDEVGIDYGTIWNSVNNTILTFGHYNGGVGNDIVEINCTTKQDRVINNMTLSLTNVMACWYNNGTNWYAFALGGENGGVQDTVLRLDLGVPYTEPPEPASTFAIRGLEGSDYNITWTGTISTTVWSNETNPGGTLELNMSINATNNVTEIRVYCDDLDASILASNITMSVSSDNSSFDSMGTFTDGGSNISINTSTWPGGGGTNPFTYGGGAGLTNTTTSIYMRFQLAIGAIAGTYSQNDWKLYVGNYE